MPDGSGKAVKAMTVERLLIWTYQDQATDTIVGRGGAYMRVVGIDSARRAGDRMALGCEVMGGGYARLTVHPDAEAIHDAVKTLGGRLRARHGKNASTAVGLVIRCAKAGTRPGTLRLIQTRPLKIERANGKPEMVYYDVARSRPAYCLLHYDPLPEHVALDRAMYRLWWDALDDLAAYPPSLYDHIMLPLGEPREPWST
ncbi:MAG: hypothetical protein IH626_05440 [Rhodospirillales bacterium]|nr:hypothetical protein [Rhodospirillales bacterium]